MPDPKIIRTFEGASSYKTNNVADENDEYDELLENNPTNDEK